jgi:H+-transporting ATPase
MSSTTDNVRPSIKPNAWRIDNLTIAGLVMGSCNLIFCSGVLAIGKFCLDLGMETLRTLAAVTLVFSGQAVFYVVRERRRWWSSRPSLCLMLSSVFDVLIIVTLAAGGILMTPLPLPIVVGTLAAAVALAFILDSVKLAVFHRLKMA